MKDNFSKQSELYAQYRPAYPPALFEYISNFVANKNTAWDCGTGNGQSAVALSRYFKKVIATDISSKQINLAEKASNIFYSVQPSERSPFPLSVSRVLHFNCVNLKTGTQAEQEGKLFCMVGFCAVGFVCLPMCLPCGVGY